MKKKTLSWKVYVFGGLTVVAFVARFIPWKITKNNWPDPQSVNWFSLDQLSSVCGSFFGVLAPQCSWVSIANWVWWIVVLGLAATTGVLAWQELKS